MAPRKNLLFQVEDAQQGTVVGCDGPLGVIDDAAGLLVEEWAEGSAGEDVVEAGVEVLIIPVVGPHFAARILVRERFEVTC
jgi:hypothetical protein